MTRYARQTPLAALTLALAMTSLATAQDNLQQKLAAAELNAAENQQALRSYGCVVLSLPASKIEVRITNSSYQKLAQ